MENQANMPAAPGNYTENQMLGVMLVGLGEYSSGQLGPALKETKHCCLKAVASGDPAKRKKWQQEYNLKEEDLYSYDNFDDIKNNPGIDIVYIVLPNSMHAEYVIRAAKAGKHVICEKPLATTVADCQRMIRACQEAGVKLSMGYRLYFDHFNQEMMRLGQEKVMGNIKRIIADDSMDVGEKNQWRLKYQLSGGGPLVNNGVYCVRAAQYVTGEWPVAVSARFLPKTDPDKFKEVEEGIEWEMEFENGLIASCVSSYSRNGNLLRVEAENGWFELEPAYEYEGLKGKTSQGDMDFPAVNQQAVQMDDFAICLKNKEESRIPGEMGLRDVQIMTAIYESAKTGKKIKLQLAPADNLIHI
ncbi:Gfo/Idh/MocA family protein [Longitalea luteola]|uniref:Gfo/Idh/MocA family protein n=1 Tax=Longitalea luteola TaxID=2812563 RepID=UPI001A96CFB9|nr:Gfo/Idh/MocA family oxidoreductase [Longitalea luteola]